jgi:hypothetical protein
VQTLPTRLADLRATIAKSAGFAQIRELAGEATARHSGVRRHPLWRTFSQETIK